ncbi:MAG: hypothetical protein DWI21_08900 [Planctomycetota bacterium]|nr:MAG: hypothetical protein DWI21_08900 [Planctomycetota bacterium]GDY10646.1 hypothetical protein LBMAG52_41340 [Planctomycetia bacterium]
MKPTIALLVFGLVAVEVVADDPSQSKSIPTPSKDTAAGPTQRGVIVAASDATSAAHRFKTLIAQDAGLNFAVVSPNQKHDVGDLQFVFCTKASRSELKHLLPAAALSADLKPQGFLISTDSTTTQAVVIGGDPDGLRYGVGELWHYHCSLDGKRIVPQNSLWLVKAPAFSKRMFWNWTHCTNWDDDLSRVHQTKHVDAIGTLEPYLVQPNGFVDTFQKVVDFQADHKLNGLIVWGFINDAHGGLATAQSVSKYAKANGVKILPGIGTMGYGGFYFGGNHPFNISTFLAKHPQVRLMVQADGKDMPGTPCPSDLVFQQWLRDGAEWYFTTLKDIGGVNLEHGDFFQCHCPRCKMQRSLPENDQNYHWDMMATQVPVIERGLKISPDLWFSYACYDAYSAALLSNPPKFLAQYPKSAITQWTYTKMIADPILNPAGSWPLSLRPPTGTNHSVGLLHQGSHWDVKRQWWGESDKSAVAFGGTYSLVSDLIQQTCHRAIADQSEGLQIIGQIGAASPQNELNYLALEAFSWNPQLDYQTWIDRELAPLYGGPKLSRRYYELVSNITKLPQEIASDIQEAQQTHTQMSDPRQARRWANLISELRRRQTLTP